MGRIAFLFLVPVLLAVFGSALGAEEKALSPETMKRLGSSDPAQRDQAVQAFVAAGKVAVPSLTAILRRGDETVQTSAVLCLERIGSPSALGAVVEFLKGAQSLLARLYAVKALGKLGNASTRAVLRPYLEYEGPKRLDPSVGWIADKARETETGLIRNQAAESLARLGEFKGVPLLIDNLASNGWVRRDALIRLRRMTGCKVDFGYNLGSARSDRDKVIEAWKTWWSANARGFKPDWTTSHNVFDVNKRGGGK